MNLKNCVTSTKNFLSKNSPAILTGIGIAGMATSTVLAVQATPKALLLLEEEKRNQNVNTLDIKETIRVAWRPYVPAAIIGALSVTCIIGASAIHTKRNAALATVYAISERTLLNYKDKVVEAIGEKKEKEIRDSIAQDKVNENPVSSTYIIDASKGNTLFMDSFTGRYFKSDMNAVKNAEIDINRELLSQNYISLNSVYSILGLEKVKRGYDLGWNVDNKFEFEFSTTMAEDTACIVLDFSVPPTYDYDKFL